MRRLGVVAALVISSSMGCSSKKDAARDTAAKEQAGQPLAWKLDVGESLDVVAGGGVVLVLKEDNLEGVKDGKVAWTANVGKNDGWVLPLSTGCALLSLEDKGELVCVGFGDGSTKWTAKLVGKPEAPGDGDGPMGEPPPSVVVSSLMAPGKAILVLSDGRWAVVDGAACAEKRDTCVVASKESSARSPTPFDTISANAKGVRTRNRLDDVEIFDEGGKRTAVLDGKIGYFGVVMEDGKVVAALDEVVARIDPEKCKVGEGEVIRVGAESRLEAVAPPPGCLEKLGDAQDPFVAATVGEDVVIVASRELRRLGTKTWKSSVDAASAPTIVGDTIYVACWQEAKDMFVTHVDLCAVNAGDGALRWRTKLDLEKVGMLDVPLVLADQGLVFVNTKTQLAAVAAK